MAKAERKKTSTAAKKKTRRVVTEAIVSISSTFNNTIVTFSDLQGNVISWSTPSNAGIKGAKKSTTYAAQVASETAARRAKEMGVESVYVQVKGAGSGRDSSIRAINAVGLRVLKIEDITPIPHNGCRPPKRRRV